MTQKAIDRYGHLEESFLRDAAKQAEERVWEAYPA
jgi:hypothetical protein